MIDLLSRIIIKEWFKSFIGAITVLFLLITSGDLINQFLQGKDFSRVLLEYSLKMPDLMGKMLPICTLVATLFSFNRLKAQSELIALLAAGFSYIRIYLLIGICSLCVFVLQFLNLGFIEPMANKIKRQEIQKSRVSEGKYLTRSSLEGGRFWYKTPDYFASFLFFDRKTQSLKDLELYFFNSSHRSAEFIKAESATYTSDNNWRLDFVKKLSDLDQISFPQESSLRESTIRLNETPEDFGEFEADLTTLNFIKLRQFIRRLKKTGINIAEYEILLLNKIFLSLICIVFALVPLSTIFNPNRRSSSFGKNVVTTLVITVSFWVLYSSSVALGNSGKIPPIIATSSIPTCFLVFALFQFTKNRKLSQ